MTTEKALEGKPYAGNPHARFDGGEVASCTEEASLRRVHCRRQPEGRASVCATTPRRGSLLYEIAVLVLASAVTWSGFADDSVIAWADDTIAVDMSRDDFRVVLGDATLRCSPDWCTGGTNVAGAVYSIEAVENPCSGSAVTSAVPAQILSGECDVPYSGEGWVRFLLKASVNGVAVGETLVSDVSFGMRSGLSAAIAYDNRAGTLQEIAGSGKPVNLAYDTSWAEGAASLEISALKLSGSGADAMATNTIMSVTADADGTTTMRGVGRGWWRLLCRISGESGEPLLEYLTDEFKMPSGFLLNIR